MKLTGNLCVICGHDSAMHCCHAHSDGSACCDGCMSASLIADNTVGRCPGALAEAEALLDTIPGLRENLHAAIGEWRAGTLRTVDASTALERIEARIKCPMCGEPRSGAPEPWCAGKDNHDEWQS